MLRVLLKMGSKLIKREQDFGCWILVADSGTHVDRGPTVRAQRSIHYILGRNYEKEGCSFLMLAERWGSRRAVVQAAVPSSPPIVDQSHNSSACYAVPK
jgi:hypothetical protein